MNQPPQQGFTYIEQDQFVETELLDTASLQNEFKEAPDQFTGHADNIIVALKLYKEFYNKAKEGLVSNPTHNNVKHRSNNRFTGIRLSLWKRAESAILGNLQLFGQKFTPHSVNPSVDSLPAHSEEEILSRAAFLKQVALNAQSAIEKALLTHENLSGKPLQNVMDKIRLSDDKLVGTSHLYYKLLDKYKIKHDYYSHDKLVGRDEVASLTSFAILKTKPFDIVNVTSDRKHVSALLTRLANEIFAMLFSLVVIKAPPKAIPPILYLSYLHNMGSLNELLHEHEIAGRGRTRQLDCTVEWMICAFKCMGLKYGDLDIRIDDGD